MKALELTAATLLLASLGTSQGAAGPRAKGETMLAVKAARFLTMDTDPIYQGVMLVKGGKIVAIGKDIQVPAGAKVLDVGERTVCPGFVDLHHHVSSGGFGVYRAVCEALKPRGAFLDLDYPQYAGGLETHLGWLRDAGFERVEQAWEENSQSALAAFK